MAQRYYPGAALGRKPATDVTGPNTATYDVPALGAGTYKFACKGHPNMVAELTVK